MCDAISIPLSVFRQIEQYCLLRYPMEACGLLIGKTATEHVAAAPNFCISVERFVGIPNIAANPRKHFMMEPASLLPYLFDFNKDGNAQIVGMIHSHPSAAAIPSAEDLNTQWTGIPSHWIVSLLHLEQPEWKAYRYVPNDTDAPVRYLPYFIQITSEDSA